MTNPMTAAVLYEGRGEGRVDAAGEALVYVHTRDGDSSSTKRLPMSKRGREKSPTGFNWGYHGSGPAALAHSILHHHAGGDIADRWYQDFKREIIAKFPADEDWAISSDEVQEWLGKRIAQKVGAG